MRKLAAVIGLLAAVSLASAAPIATTDFLGVNLTGANQTLDLLTHSGSTVDAGVASAAWTSGPDLTAVGTVGGNSIWATGWDGTAGDYIKLSVELDASYSAVIEQIRFATRRSGTGPTIGLAQLYINGGLEYTYNINMGDTNYQNVDVTGLSIAAPAGADIELRFVGSGGGSQGSWRVNTYYLNGTYSPTGILGTTTYIPEPASLVLVALGALAGLRRR